MFINENGRRGQGPGEFMAVRLVELSNNSVYVTDQYIPGIQVFDLDLKYKRQIPIQLLIADFKVLSEQRIAVTSLQPREDEKIMVFDGQGRRIGEWTYAKALKRPLLNTVNFDTDHEGNFYLVYNFQDKIEKFDKNGHKIWSRGLLRVKDVKTKKISKWQVTRETVFKDVVHSRNGYLFVLGGSCSLHKSRDVYVLDSDGNYHGTLTLPESTHCIHIDSKESFYSRTNEGITLKKYKFIFDPKTDLPII